MGTEKTMRELLDERGFPIAALALVAEIEESTAGRIVAGLTRPRGTTAVRMAEGLGIGYGRMRRILAATWEAGQPARAEKARETVPPAPLRSSSALLVTTGPAGNTATQDFGPGSAAR